MRIEKLDIGHDAFERHEIRLRIEASPAVVRLRDAAEGENAASPDEPWCRTKHAAPPDARETRSEDTPLAGFCQPSCQSVGRRPAVTRYFGYPLSLVVIGAGIMLITTLSLGIWTRPTWRVPSDARRDRAFFDLTG
jgi:hypothetical protein